jgi:hypothetical protein
LCQRKAFLRGEGSGLDWDSTCFFLVCAVAVMCGAALDYRKRELMHRERLAAIEKGIVPASLNERPLQFYFRRGLLWLIPGLGLGAFLWFVSWDFRTAWGGTGVLMTCLGLAYLLCYFYEARRGRSS